MCFHPTLAPITIILHNYTQSNKNPLTKHITSNCPPIGGQFLTKPNNKVGNSLGKIPQKMNILVPSENIISKLGASVNLIVNHLITIPQILNEMQITVEKNLRQSLLSRYRNEHLGLLNVLKAKPCLTNTSPKGGTKHPIC